MKVKIKNMTPNQWNKYCSKYHDENGCNYEKCPMMKWVDNNLGDDEQCLRYKDFEWTKEEIQVLQKLRKKLNSEIEVKEE